MSSPHRGGGHPSSTRGAPPVPDHRAMVQHRRSRWGWRDAEQSMPRRGHSLPPRIRVPSRNPPPPTFGQSRNRAIVTILIPRRKPSAPSRFGSVHHAHHRTPDQSLNRAESLDPAFAKESFDRPLIRSHFIHIAANRRSILGPDRESGVRFGDGSVRQCQDSGPLHQPPPPTGG